MTTPDLRAALEAYRASPIDAYDRPASWRALANLLEACDLALAQPEPLDAATREKLHDLVTRSTFGFRERAALHEAIGWLDKGEETPR